MAPLIFSDNGGNCSKIMLYCDQALLYTNVNVSNKKET